MDERGLRRIFRGALALTLPVTAMAQGCVSGGTSPDQTPVVTGPAPAPAPAPDPAPAPATAPTTGPGVGFFRGGGCPQETHVVAVAGGTVNGVPLSADNCLAACQAAHTAAETCQVVDQNGSPAVACSFQAPCMTGRRPHGQTAVAAPEHAAGPGGYFTTAARLEAASVTAFGILGAELAAHGAPRRLVALSRRARRDEVRHVRLTNALARRCGARQPGASVPHAAGMADARPSRSLEAMALENAVEGCVRETYGALVAHWQAERATDPVIRAAMGRIARDETRHAALGWQVAAWANTRLDRAARGRVDAARQAALEALATELAAEPPGELVARAGLPDGTRSRALLDFLAQALRAQA